jgi:hypothetical protein
MHETPMETAFTNGLDIRYSGGMLSHYIVR